MNIHLEPFGRSDFRRLIRWVSNAEFMLLWSGPYFTFPLNETQLEAYLQSAEGVPPPRKIFKAVNRETGEVVGHIELNMIDWKNLSGMVSKVLVGYENRRGNGIGTQMMQRLIEVAFEDLGLHRLSLYVFDFNEPAINCYKKVGFKIEGHLRDFRKAGNNRYYSSYLMALLQPDWLQENAK
ncbi:MAG: GNAT family N-acetyltransferase [Anaerolineae bacterium]|nr:GNAT family N-acetyltransferase [Anaerolineae bacterium]